MNLEEKIATNTWDHISDFFRVLRRAESGQWHWFKNSKCKYVELRVDMRTGNCIIKDRDGNRIDPKDLEFQFKEDHGLNPDYPEHRPMHESEG